MVQTSSKQSGLKLYRPHNSRAISVIAHAWAAEIYARRLSKVEVAQRVRAYPPEVQAEFFTELRRIFRGQAEVRTD